MRINTLALRNLRNHVNTDLELSKGINIFHGLNGSGKTTILEAISICAFSKTFLPCNDSAIVRIGEEEYSTALRAENDYSIGYKVSVGYRSGLRKAINSSIGESLLPKDIIGEIPTVILSPDFKSITFGAPEDRRQFIDRILSQSNRIYLETLLKYRKTLKQRNSLLSSLKADPYADDSVLPQWTDLLADLGSEIIIRRNQFLKEFTLKFSEIYGTIARSKEPVLMSYLPNGIINDQNEIIADSKETIKSHLINKLSEKKQIEIIRGSTLYGPHKDEVIFTVNGGIAKDYASQGQHKSLLIALKFAEFDFLKEKKNETPIILLDDIFAELDEERISKVFDMIEENSAQTFITLTDLRQIEKFSGGRQESKNWKLDKGKAIMGEIG